ncbi:patellin-4 [Herrania umbratica]|uniref:Patellin-4 n=1 Tax=Herrania umbratica TaxID=108875 RepID=A0A6J1BGH3_9ROSI|nr:patellin-4 [Herrania umbratica]
MVVEVKVDETQAGQVFVTEEEPKKVAQDNGKVVDSEIDDSKPKTVEKSSSYREESNFLSDLKEFEKKALSELKSKLEEAILGNSLLRKQEPEKDEKPSDEKEEKEKEVAEEKEKEEEAKGGEEGESPVGEEEAKPEGGEEEKTAQECEEKKSDEQGIEIKKDVSIWGVPLLPCKGGEATDVVLLKFLRAREFKVNDAFEMLKNTLQWRKGGNIDSILDEDFGAGLGSAAYMNGIDKEGHPVCYNIYGAFENEELYKKTFGTEEKRGQFLRWRFQLMEKGIQKLDLRPGGVTCLLQINDLKNSPGPSRKELRVSMKQAVGALQDNYPEFVARNIFINVPFWYYALNALLSPFLTQRTKSKFVVARPAKVTETLLKYIPAEDVPVQYGGFKKENEFEFCGQDATVTEIIVKAGSTKTIEIPADEVGSTSIWELIVLGWEVNYKAEFVPSDEGSYTIIVQKSKKISVSQSQEGPIGNTFRNNEPGKLVLTIENTSSKKKRVLYRYKTKKSSPF